MIGFTAWSCVALVAHFQMLTSACLRAAGTASAIVGGRYKLQVADIDKNWNRGWEEDGQFQGLGVSLERRMSLPCKLRCAWSLSSACRLLVGAPRVTFRLPSLVTRQGEAGALVTSRTELAFLSGALDRGWHQLPRHWKCVLLPKMERCQLGFPIFVCSSPKGIKRHTSSSKGIDFPV
jgi:hypothetical protein